MNKNTEWRELTIPEIDEWLAGHASYAEAVETEHGVLVRGEQTGPQS